MLPENESFFVAESFTRDVDYQNFEDEEFSDPGSATKQTLENIDKNLEDITNYEMSRGIIDNWQNFKKQPTKSKLDLKAFDFEKHCLLSLVIIRADNSWRGHLNNHFNTWATHAKKTPKNSSPNVKQRQPINQDSSFASKDFFGDISAIRKDILTVAADDDGVGTDRDDHSESYTYGFGYGREGSIGGMSAFEVADGGGESGWKSAKG